MAQRPRAAPANAHSGACSQCRALDGNPAKDPPHEALQLVDSVQTESGMREVFTCKSCGQRMQRFIAKQTNPPPSDRWRVS